MKILITAHVNGLSDDEALKVIENIKKFSKDNVNVEIEEGKTIAESIANSGLVIIENDELVYLEEVAGENEETKITVVRNEAKRTEKLFLNGVWLVFNLDGKNRHINKIRGMRMNAKKIGYSKGEMEGIELNEYTEDMDVNLFIQSKYVVSWSLLDKVDVRNIAELVAEMTGDMKLLLDRAAQDFLEYRRNGLVLSKEETEKKK